MLSPYFAFSSIFNYDVVILSWRTMLNSKYHKEGEKIF
jgi:hypothetical protein